MQPTLQDFSNQVDFTAQNLSGSILNLGFTSLQGNTTGDGLSGIVPTIWTKDTALNTPNVPQPAGIGASKWKNYIWYRIPYTSDTTSAGKAYTWNDAATSVATYLKWIDTTFDDTAILSQLATLSTNVASALNAANTANTNSANALAQATAAVTVANNASNGVAAATSAASAASVAATQANTTANASSATANAANATAASALSVAQQSRSITNATPGSTGQRIRTSYAVSPALEYFNVADTIVIAKEVYGTGIFGVGAAFGFPFVTKPLNTKSSDTGSLATLINTGTGNGGLQFVKGTYRYSIIAQVAGNGVTGIATTRLYETQNGTLIDIIGVRLASNVNIPVMMEGIFTTDGTTIYVIQIQSPAVAGAGAIIGGYPTNSGINEIYTIATFERIG